MKQLGLGHEFGEIDAAANFAFHELEPLLELAEPVAELADDRRRVVPFLRPGHLGVAEVPLQGREEIEWIASLVGASDLAFLFAEEDRVARLVVGSGASLV